MWLHYATITAHMKNEIEIYTDGSCIGNPGPGGWGVVILHDGEEIELSGAEKDTTNNRMEMTAVIRALEWTRYTSGIKEEDYNKYEIIINSDSNLIIQTLNQGWKRKANLDLWGEIDRLRAWLNIEWKWVKAHNNDHYNERADTLAFNEAKAQ